MKLTILSACRLIAIPLLAAAAARLNGQEPTFRSSAEPRPWLADERQLPRWRERQSHRGFEVSTGPIVVIAANAVEARTAAEEAAEVWKEAAATADRFTAIHRQPNFAQGAVQLVLGDLRAPASEAPAAPSVASLGRVIQIVASGSRDDGDPQRGRKELRQAVAHAFFRAIEFDESLPAWVSQGLAASVAGVRPRGEDKDDAAAQVVFLLEGNDGRHAGPFFELLRRELAAARPDVDRKFPRLGGTEAPPTQRNELVERFFAELSDEYEAWRLDPHIGQPLLSGADGEETGLHAAQQELAFVLKLADRFRAEATAGIRTKVRTFDAKRREAVAVTHQSAAQPPSLAALLSRITAEGQPSWATIGPDGKLLWSDDAETLSGLLGVEQRRYHYAWREGKWVLETTLADGRKLSGWMEPNPENEHRPLAKFSVAVAR